MRGEIFGLVRRVRIRQNDGRKIAIRVTNVSKGEILINGVRISAKSAHSLAGSKEKNSDDFQDPSASLNDRANVDYIVSEGLRAFHLYEDETDRLEKVEEMMRRVGLRPEHLKRYPHEFSGGQRQRIGIARSMIIKPELIVADEPISALDVSIRAQVLNLIKEFQKDRALDVLFIAHDYGRQIYSDRIARIYNGKIGELARPKGYSKCLYTYTKSLLSVFIPEAAR